MVQALSLCAVVLAFVSACFWFFSAKCAVVIPQAWLSGPPKEIVAQIKKQSSLNTWAAALTGASVLCQAVSMLLQNLASKN